MFCVVNDSIRLRLENTLENVVAIKPEYRYFKILYYLDQSKSYPRYNDSVITVQHEINADKSLAAYVSIGDDIMKNHNFINDTVSINRRKLISKELILCRDWQMH
jgi:hypothetical protein